MRIRAASTNDCPPRVRQYSQRLLSLATLLLILWLTAAPIMWY